jgi:hypothetical protein
MFFGYPSRSLHGCYVETILLQRAYEKWKEEGCPSLSPDHAVEFYEGCDIYVRHTDGREWAQQIDDDGNGLNQWEELG